MIRVVPRASSISIEQEGPTQYKVRLTSPPVDGAANSQLIEVLSKKLSIASRCIEIARGQTARVKRVKLHGVDVGKIPQLLLAK